jgi:hypothetical protein
LWINMRTNGEQNVTTEEQCPLWVKSRHVQRKKVCPLCTRKRP